MKIMNKFAFDFKDTLDHLPVAIVITKVYPIDDWTGLQIVYANQAYCQQNGYSDDQVIGKQIIFPQLLEPPENAEVSLSSVLDRKQGSRLVYKKENDPDEDKWMELTIKPMKDSGGEITHFVFIERDISEQKQLEKLYREAPKKDALTGLMNHGAFDEVMRRELSIYLRTKQTYSLLIIDIDHFRKVHENYGSAACDQVLVQLANIFEDIFRSYDNAARTGHDQFSVLLHSTSLEQALISAIRLRQSVRNKAFIAGGKNIQVTVSVGISHVLPEDTKYTRTVERAEKALLVAKNNGRDEVQIFKEGMTG